MADDSKPFNELFSQLTNSLQAALLLAGERATAARVETAESDQLYNAITRAVSAARAMRPTGDEPNR